MLRGEEHEIPHHNGHDGRIPSSMKLCRYRTRKRVFCLSIVLLMLPCGVLGVGWNPSLHPMYSWAATGVATHMSCAASPGTACCPEGFEFSQTTGAPSCVVSAGSRSSCGCVPGASGCSSAWFPCLSRLDLIEDTEFFFGDLNMSVVAKSSVAGTTTAAPQAEEVVVELGVRRTFKGVFSLKFSIDGSCNASLAATGCAVEVGGSQSTLPLQVVHAVSGGLVDTGIAGVGRCIVPLHCIVGGSTRLNTTSVVSDFSARFPLTPNATEVRRPGVFMSGYEFSVRGPVAAVNFVLIGLSYKPYNNYNSIRFRSVKYFPMMEQSAFTTNPESIVEMLTSNVSAVSAGTFEYRKTLIDIRDTNDAPEIEDPQVGYIPRTQQEKDFGQFFRDEGSTGPLRIGGVDVVDEDFFEDRPVGSCDGSLQCASRNDRKLDVIAKVLRGVIGLNSRTGLEIYNDRREVQGFTGKLSDVRNALRVLVYQVEQVESLATSTNLDFNTQHGTNEETLVLTVSDQGFSGVDGIAKLSEIRLKITIIAVNDPPTISFSVNEFVVMEDSLTSVAGISVHDVDVNEQIKSALASRDWMGKREYASYLNKMTTFLSVRHGTIVPSTLRNLDVVHGVINTAPAGLVAVLRPAVFVTLSAAGVFSAGDPCVVRSNEEENSMLNEFTAVKLTDVCVKRSGGQCFVNPMKEVGGVWVFDVESCVGSNMDVTYVLDATHPNVDSFIDGFKAYMHTRFKRCGSSRRAKPCESDADCAPGILTADVCQANPSWCVDDQEERQRCLPVNTVSDGTRVSILTQALREYGTKKLGLFGSIADINSALSQVKYVGDLNFNRLYRPPLSERDQNFNVETDYLDSVEVVVSDLGNSGGKERDVKVISSSINVRALQVNDPPSIVIPTSVSITEDTPARFCDECAFPRVEITDPDYLDHGFSKETLILNISCVHGKISLNNTYLSSICVKTPEGGCPCTVCSFEFFWGTGSGDVNMSFAAPFEQMNGALSMLEYMPLEDFNTDWGLMEEVHLSVSDEGAVGDGGSLRDKKRVVVEVAAVNDPPVVTFLHTRTPFPNSSVDCPEPTVLRSFSAGSSSSSVSYVCENFTVNGGFHKGFEVPEDQSFSILPTSLWITDVDADEETRTGVPTASAGEVLVSSSVSHGTIRFFPSGDFDSVEGLSFLNASDEGVGCNVPVGAVEAMVLRKPVGDSFVCLCPTPTVCSNAPSGMGWRVKGSMCENRALGVSFRFRTDCIGKGSSSVRFIGRLSAIQRGLLFGFFTYEPSNHYYGTDVLELNVNDMGYSGRGGSGGQLSVSASLPVNVTFVNDDPVVLSPKSVLLYQKGSLKTIPPDSAAVMQGGGTAIYSKLRRLLLEIPREGLIGKQSKSVAIDAQVSLYQDLSSSNEVRLAVADVDAYDEDVTVQFKIGRDECGHRSLFVNSSRLTELNVNCTLTGLEGGEVTGPVDLLPAFHSTGIDSCQHPIELNGCGGTRSRLLMAMRGKIWNINDALGQIFFNASATQTGHHVLEVRMYDFKMDNLSSTMTGGESFETVDIVVGAEAGCAIFSDCKECNKMPGCGWCPGHCSGQGKCMTGTRGGPLFESCVAHPVDGRTWMQCIVVGLDVVTVAVAGGLSFVFLVLFGYHGGRWIRRRHGTLGRYLRKKRHDFKRVGRKLHILPPDTAKYNQFFFLLAIVIVGIMLPTVILPGANNDRTDFYLDDAKQLLFETDQCDVRFLPAAMVLESLEAIFVRIRVYTHPLIEFDYDVCSASKRFTVQDTRSDERKYLGYYCYITIAVPPSFILPDTEISSIAAVPTTDDGNATGSNSTAAAEESSRRLLQKSLMRGRSLLDDDDDEEGDEEEGGEGEGEEAVEDNMEALGVGITTVRSGPMDADVNASDPEFELNFGPNSFKLTGVPGAGISARFRNLKAKNMVFTADNGELNAEHVEIRNGTFITQSADIVLSTLLDASVRYSQPKNLSCLVAAKGALFWEGKDAINYAACRPVIVQKKNCLQDCEVTRIVCEEYSSADLYGTSKFKRSSPGKLGQQFVISSNDGVVSVTVLDGDSPYEANQEVSQTCCLVDGAKVCGSTLCGPNTVDIKDEDKVVLDEMFHPGGENGPKQQYFRMPLQGPGAPPRTTGSFVWLRNVRYVVLPAYLLDVISFSLLSPARAQKQLQLRPAFCPPRVMTEAAELDRLKALHEMLLYTLVTPTTPGADLRPTPAGSVIMFEQVTGPNKVFELDPASNELVISQVGLQDNTILFILVILGILIPVIFSGAVVSVLLILNRKKINEYRKERLRQEVVSMNMLETNNLSEDDIEDQIDPKKAQELTARTNWFYMLSEWTGSAEEQKSFFAQWVEVLKVHFGNIVAPAIMVALLALQLNTANKAYACEFRIDKDVCSAFWNEMDILPLFLFVWVGLYLSVAVLELGVYYLQIPYGKFRRILRNLFYTLYFLTTQLGFMYVVVVALWTLLGVLVNPAKVGPYATAVVGAVAHGASMYAKLKKFQVRVQKNVTKRVMLYKSKMGKSMPKPLLDVMMGKNVEQALHDAGLSPSKVIVAVIASLVLLMMIFAFLFVGIMAFTDPTDGTAGAINSSMTGGATGALNQAGGEGNEDETKEKVEEMSGSIQDKLKAVFKMIGKQIKMAMKLMKKMQKGMSAMAGAGEALAEAGKEVYKAETYEAKQRFKTKKALMKHAVLEDKYERAMGGRGKKVEVAVEGGSNGAAPPQ